MASAENSGLPVHLRQTLLGPKITLGSLVRQGEGSLIAKQAKQDQRVSNNARLLFYLIFMFGQGYIGLPC